MCTAFRILVGACVLLAVAQCYPDGSRDHVEERTMLPPRNGPFNTPYLDFGDDSDYSDESSGFSIPFSGFMSSMRGVMDMLKQQMADVLSRIPDQGSIVSWGKIPEGANTTSTTKVINGHVVTINETTYTSGNDETGTVFRVRIVDVRPQDETSDSPGLAGDSEPATIDPVDDESTTPGRSVETIEDLDNEIPNAQAEVLTA